MSTVNIFSAARAEMADLLRVDITALNPGQAVRLDFATSLRLEVDRLLAGQMAGQPVDIGRLTTASRELEQMLSTAAAQADTWDLTRLSDDELDQLARLAAKATGQILDLEVTHIGERPRQFATSLEAPR